ncbi:MAG TPA: response regulator [Bacteroidia bacterium]|mgnify:CR=1 FL=1|nr:response regulator [Bacteroidia bacterium]HNP98700.1 response regulator [Bacteroidia bacterium]
MIRTILVDDEQHCIDRLQMLLQNDHAAEVEILHLSNTVEDGVNAIRKMKPDLIFLDIQIHNRTGFDLLQEIGNEEFDVIFTTAYDTFALKAFKFSAVDYLLKPIDPDDLAISLKKVLSKKEARMQSDKLDALYYNLKNLQAPSKKICIPVSNGKEILSVNDIVRCQSDVNYTYLFMKDKSKITVSKTLKEFEELLSDYNFFRIHNSHLVNLSYVKSYNSGKGGVVILSDGTAIDVSMRRKEEFLKRLEEL